MTEAEREALFGPELYDRIRREAQEWAEKAPPLDEEQRSRLKVLLAPTVRTAQAA
jgi:hypothetical protein